MQIKQRRETRHIVFNVKTKKSRHEEISLHDNADAGRADRIGWCRHHRHTSGRGRHRACRLPMARLQARMYDHGRDYTYDVPHSRWRIPFYDSAHGQTLSSPHRATNRWRATD